MSNHWKMMAMVVLAACAGGDGVSDSGAVDTGDAVVDPCFAEGLAEDFVLDETPYDIGDPATWGDFPPDAIVATTYLRLNPDNLDVFGQVVGPVVEELMRPPAGMLAMSTGQSATCGVARTLTVWQDEASMMAFVASPAHSAAMAATADVSRGGSITMTWRVNEVSAVDWDSVVPELAAHDGPVY